MAVTDRHQFAIILSSVLAVLVLPVPAAATGTTTTAPTTQSATKSPLNAKARELRNLGRPGEAAAVLDRLIAETSDPTDRTDLLLLAAQFRVGQNELDMSRSKPRPGQLPAGFEETNQALAKAVAEADPALAPENYAIVSGMLGQRLAQEDRTRQSLIHRDAVIAAFDGMNRAGEGSQLPAKAQETWLRLHLAEGDSLAYYGFRDEDPTLSRHAVAAYRMVLDAVGMAGARKLDEGFPLELASALGGVEAKTGDIALLDEAVGVYTEGLPPSLAIEREKGLSFLLSGFIRDPAPEGAEAITQLADTAFSCARPIRAETCAILAARASIALNMTTRRQNDPDSWTRSGAMAELAGDRLAAIGANTWASAARMTTGQDLVHLPKTPDRDSNAIAIRLLEAAVARETEIADLDNRADTWEALAIALRRRGEWGEGIADYEASRAAIAKALSHYKRGRNAHMWAHAETRRLETEIAMAERTGEMRLLDMAEQGLAETRNVFVSSGHPNCADEADKAVARATAVRTAKAGQR